MRNSPGYIVMLLALIGGLAGYTYYDSEVQTLRITGKHTEEGRSRYSMSSSRFVVETDQGEYRLMTFPLIGFTFGAEDVFSNLQPGDTVEARIGRFPPAILNSSARPQIMALY